VLIAVTSSDGLQVDTHFGKADRFLVYDVGIGEPALAFEVQVPCYCTGAGHAHALMPEKLAAVVGGFGACRVLVTAMIGDAPRMELNRLGIEVIVIAGPISEVLQEVIKLY